MGKARSSGPLSLDGREAEATSSLATAWAGKWPATRRAGETSESPAIHSKPRLYACRGLGMETHAALRSAHTC